MSSKPEQERVSIWSVEHRERERFILIAWVFFLLGLVYVLWYKHQPEDDVYKTLFNLIESVGPMGLFAVTVTLFLIEGVKFMFLQLEKYYRMRFEEGWQEGRQKGQQEGHQEGRQEGRQEGLQEGRQEGLQEGRQKGQQETLAAIQAVYPDVDVDIDRVRTILEENGSAADSEK